mgnify:CR=1 FL=1
MFLYQILKKLVQRKQTMGVKKGRPTPSSQFWLRIDLVKNQNFGKNGQNTKLVSTFSLSKMAKYKSKFGSNISQFTKC